MQTLQAFGVLAFPNIDPVFFSIGPVKLHWYGVAYVAGILCGWLYGRSLVSNAALWPNGVSPITRLQIDDFILWITGGIILGGRIGSILFYDFHRYSVDPFAMIRIWDGGMSFHGGLIGVVVAIAIFTYRQRIPIWSLVDVTAACVPFGLLFGRIANFINSELWGAPSTVPWAVVFPNGGPEARHPSQLYEGLLEGVALWLALRLLTHRLKLFRRPRFVGAVFIGGYGCARIFVEFFRVPDVQLGYLLGTGWLTMGMVLSIPMLLVALWGMLSARETVHAQHPAPDGAATGTGTAAKP